MTDPAPRQVLAIHLPVTTDTFVKLTQAIDAEFPESVIVAPDQHNVVRVFDRPTP